MTTVKQAILRAYLQLLHESTPAEISVKQIVLTAQISRSSFYVHYNDKDKVWEELRTTLFHQFLSLYRLEQNKQTLKADIVILCEHVLMNRSFYQTVFKNSVESELLATQLAQHLSYIFEDPDFAIFASYGTIGYLKAWVQQGFQMSPSDAAVKLLKIGFTDWTMTIKKKFEKISIMASDVQP